MKAGKTQTQKAQEKYLFKKISQSSALKGSHFYLKILRQGREHSSAKIMEIWTPDKKPLRDVNVSIPSFFSSDLPSRKIETLLNPIIPQCALVETILGGNFTRPKFNQFQQSRFSL